MSAKKKDTPVSWIDPDDAPELTDDFFIKATPKIGDKVVSKEAFKRAAKKALRGRPAGTGNKSSTTIRVDTDILERFKKGGKGWQTRINKALRDWLEEHKSA